MNTDSIIDNAHTYIQKHLDSKRYHHVMETVKTATALARRYDVPVNEAKLAALLHDIGRSLDKERMIRYVKDRHLRIPFFDDILRHNPLLLHCFIGAHMAQDLFGIRNREILNAIRYHTIAREHTSRLGKIIFISDLTSPERRYRGVDKLRKESRRDLDSAFQMALANKILHVIQNKQWLHPWAAEAWNAMIPHFHQDRG